MEVNLNVPKSKSYNVCLRMLQLGLQLALAYWAIFYDGLSDCDPAKYHLISYLGYAVVLVNLVGLLVISCSQKFPRLCFFLSLGLNLLLGAGIIAVSVIGYQHHNQCASNKVMFQFSAVSTALSLILAFLILCFQLSWVQRYTNAPGNFAWAILFLQKGWTHKFYLPLLILGCLQGLVTFITMLVHLSSCNGVTSKKKMVLQIQWIVGIVILACSQVYACIIYFTQKAETFEENEAKKLLAVFIVVNALDILFWLWGMKSLTYQRGDQVRDDLYAGENNRYVDPPSRHGTAIYGDEISSVHERDIVGFH